MLSKSVNLQPHLLLVEDSEDDAFFFERTFERAQSPLNLHQARNGAAAIDFLKEADAANALPKIVFLDLKMPVLNGFDVLSWIGTQRFARDLPDVVLSGSDHEGDKLRAAELGARDYLIKPLTLQKLVDHLAKVSPETSPGEAA